MDTAIRHFSNSEPPQVELPPKVNVMSGAELESYIEAISDERLLRKLASSKIVEIRRSIAQNPSTPLPVLAILQEDPNQFVSWEAWQNIRQRALPQIPFQLLRQCFGLASED